jgi:hypothetical protein
VAETPQTPEQWLPILTKRLDDRRPRIDLLRSYTNGDAPLPEGTQNVRPAWVAFQKKARTNFGALVVDALAERMIPNGITVGDTQGDNDAARQIWRANRLDVAVSDTIRDALTVSIGYMVVGKGADGNPVVTSELPEMTYASVDPLQPWVARAAVKVWRDLDVLEDYAYVWVTGGRQKFSRSMYSNPDQAARYWKVWTSTTGGWKPEGDFEPYTGTPPVFVFENHDCMGEFEPHTDILDRINKGLLDRIVMMAMQAFRQRAVKGELPETDESGKTVDYAAIFAPAPGALWRLPDGADIWESQESAQSIIAALSAEKDDIRDLGAVTRTPLPMLAPDGENQSAAGSEFAKEGLVMKAKDRISRFKPSLNATLERAMKIANKDFTDTVDVGFADPTHVTTSEKYDAATKAQSVGIPFRTIALDILGFSAEKVDAMEVEREIAALSTPEPPTPPAAPELVTAGAGNTQ